MWAAIQAQLRHNYRTHDQSNHTEINDFYRNVYQELPADSVLLGSSGVFGYDMFYFQYVYNVRPDVTVPSSGLAFGQRATWPNDGRTKYSVDPNSAWPEQFRPATGRAEWSVPVLVTPAHNAKLFLRRDLVLYRVSSTAPQLIDDKSTPAIPVNQSVGGVTLVGADVDSTTVKAGGTVHLKLYWRLAQLQPVPVTLSVGNEDAPSATHQVGFGLLDRYEREVAHVIGHTLIEEFDLVVLTSTPKGEQPLTIRIGPPDGDPTTITTLEVE
jgi:hypothetical protein